MQVYFSSNKNPYTSIFLWGLERIPRPCAGKKAEGLEGIKAHFAPHKNLRAHLECCCWRPLTEGPTLGALQAVREDYRSDEEGSKEDDTPPMCVCV